jgi:hypothetical protein
MQETDCGRRWVEEEHGHTVGYRHREQGPRPDRNVTVRATADRQPTSTYPVVKHARTVHLAGMNGVVEPQRAPQPVPPFQHLTSWRWPEEAEVERIRGRPTESDAVHQS